MLVDLIFSPLESNRINNLVDKSIVVIDVLRASSSIMYAFNAIDNLEKNTLKGVKSIMPVKSVEEALNVYNLSKDSNVLLAGEIDGFKPQEFHFGNSPKEFTSDRIFNKKLIMATTNGTKTLNIFKNYTDTIMIGSFLNANAISNKLIKLNKDVLIACAGTENSPSLEDISCGGYIIELLQYLALEKSIKINLSDSALISKLTFKKFKNTNEILSSSQHGINLIKKGFLDDLNLCSKNNIFNFVPTLKNNLLHAEIILKV